MEQTDAKVDIFAGTYMGFFNKIQVSHLCPRPLVPFARYLSNLDKLIVQVSDKPFIFVESSPHVAGILHERIGKAIRGKIIGFQINNISSSRHKDRIFRRLKWPIGEIVPMLTPDFTLAFGNRAGEVIDFITDNKNLVVRFHSE